MVTKRVIPVLVLFLVLVFCSGLVWAEQIYYGEYTMVREIEWEMLNFFSVNGNYADPADFLQQADEYVEQITAFLGREDWRSFARNSKIEFIATRHLPSHPAGSSTIALNVHRFGLGLAPTAREITSLIIRGFNSYSLNIGLGGAMQERFGENIAPYTLGQDPDELVGEFIDRQDLITTLGTPGYPFHLDLYPEGKDRRPLYLLSHSFVNYLLEEYGVTAVMNVYDAPDLKSAYPEFMGKDLEEIRREWLESLD